MDQDETWHAGRPRPWPHCFRWGPSVPPPKRHSPQFLAHICCDQMAGWIKVPLGTEVGVGPGHIVLDGDPAPPPRKGAQQPLTFWSTLLGHGRPPQPLLRSCNVLFLSDCFAECSRGECPPGSFQSRPCSNSTDRHCTGLSRLYTL